MSSPFWGESQLVVVPILRLLFHQVVVLLGSLLVRVICVIVCFLQVVLMRLILLLHILESGVVDLVHLLLLLFVLGVKCFHVLGVLVDHSLTLTCDVLHRVAEFVHRLVYLRDSLVECHALVRCLIVVMIVVSTVGARRTFHDAFVHGVRMLLLVIVCTLAAHAQVNDLNGLIVDKNVHIHHGTAQLQQLIRNHVQLDL